MSYEKIIVYNLTKKKFEDLKYELGWWNHYDTIDILGCPRDYDSFEGDVKNREYTFETRQKEAALEQLKKKGFNCKYQKWVTYTETCDRCNGTGKVKLRK